MFNLFRDKFGEAVQAFPLIEGQISVGATDGVASNGVFTKIHLVYCVEDGGITITFNSTGTKAVTMIADGVYSIPEASQITITSGTFHLA